VHEGATYSSYDDEDEEIDYEAGSASADAGSAGKDDDEDEDKNKDKDNGKGKDDSAIRRKSAIISFRCDRDPATTGAKLSFIEADEDECTYMFSMLSQHACAKSEPHAPGSVGPGSVFAIIFFVAVAVYVLGGVFYQRTVAHARGWRQLPNYSLWAGIWSFIQVCLLFSLMFLLILEGADGSTLGYPHYPILLVCSPHQGPARLSHTVLVTVG
jgi:cation-dependent mannose-6-phosphate receptor